MARARMNFLGIHPPVVVGTIAGINKELHPLVMLAEQPLDPRLQGGGRVLVRGSPWPSIDGQWFAIMVVAIPNAQFRLIDADTSGEEGFGDSGTVAIAETRTYVPPG